MDGKYTVGGIRYRSLARANAVRLAIGMKRCSKCGVTYPVDQFPADRGRADGVYLHCKHCLASYRESTRSARRDYARRRYRQHTTPKNEATPPASFLEISEY